MCLPKIVLALMNNPLAHSISFLDAQEHPHTSLLLVDTGATNHMISDKAAFISYNPVSDCCVCMGNTSFAPILDHGVGSHYKIRSKTVSSLVAEYHVGRFVR